MEEGSLPDYSETREFLDFGPYDFRGEDFSPFEGYLSGLSFGELLEEKAIVGHDHREDSFHIKNAIAKGLEHQDVEVQNIGLAPTDMVSYFVEEEKADGGVAVTASHMEPGNHGAKFLNNQGRICDGQELDSITENYLENLFSRNTYIKENGLNMLLGPEHYIERKQDNIWGGENNQYLEEYLDAICSRYHELFEQPVRDIEIVVDPGHGLGSLTLPRLYRNLGLEEENISVINGDLDPSFPYRDPDPTKDDLKHLSKKVLEKEADLGIATDGDADRVVFINENGEKVPGDHSLAIIGEKLLNKSDNKAPPGIACSANTSILVQEHINSLDGFINYQPVGAVFPVKAALKDKNIICGGQPNGHIFDPGFVNYDSGTEISALMTGIIEESRNSLSELQENLPHYIIERQNVPVEDKKTELNNRIDTLDKKLTEVEGIYKGFKNGQIVTLRSSGNEPVIRKTVETPHPLKTLEDIETGKDTMEIFKE